MISIFLRELRENLKWAAVIFGVLLVMVLHELRDPPTMLLFDLPQRYTLWLGPIAGLLMGVVQVLFETRPDNWGFVVHRPVPRAGIFLAKCAAGLLLLYAALALPCLVAVISAARPGRLAIPFQGRMVFPMLADVLNAGCYYFAGMVLTLRKARWLGTRLLPLGVPLASSAIAIMFIAPFWQALLVILIVQAIGAAAAWGVFADNGAAERRVATRFALGAMVYAGAIGMAIGLVGFSQGFTPGGRWQYYQVDRDGNVVLITQTIQHGERGWAFTDPAGRPLPQYDRVDLDDPAYANQFLRFNARLVDRESIPWPITVLYTSAGYRSPMPGLIPLRAVAPAGVRLRFSAVYDIPQRAIDLFDPVTRMPIGLVGPAGFSPPDQPPIERFAGTPLLPFLQGGSHVLAFDSIVYWIELDHRRVRPVFVPQPDDPVFSAAEVGPAIDSKILIATTHRLHLLERSGQLVWSAPLDQDPMRCNFDAALLPANRHLVLRTFSNPGTKPYCNVVSEYSVDGMLLHQVELPRLTDFRSPKKIETMAFGAIFPVAARAICPSWILDEVLDVKTEEFSNFFDEFMWSSAILCAILTLLIARRCGMGWSKTIAWSSANLLLGPAGVATMLALYDWPARERCVACGRSRLAARRDCSHCGAPLASAPQDGREIFEPAEAFGLHGAALPVA